MGVIALRRFGGQRPRRDARLIGDYEAQVAKNCKLWGGDLRPFYKPLLTQAAVNSGPLKSIYRYTSNGYWMHWDTDVDVARGPVAETQRIYWTGDGAPKIGNIETVAGITTVGTTAPGAQNFILVNDVSAFDAADSITIELDSGTHTTTITTIQASLDRINLTDALPSQASAGNTVTLNSAAYPHAGYLLGVPAPTTAPTVAVAPSGINSGTVSDVTTTLGENDQTVVLYSGGQTVYIDLATIDSNDQPIQFNILATLGGSFYGVQTKTVLVQVFRDPAGDNEEIFSRAYTRTIQQSDPNQGLTIWQNDDERWGGDPDSTHFVYTPSDGNHTYRLQVTHQFNVVDNSNHNSHLRLTAMLAGSVGVQLNTSSHGLKEGDTIVLGGIEGSGTLVDLNGDALSILSVNGDIVYLDSVAAGEYDTGGTWQQTWEETDLEARSYVYTYLCTLDGKEMEGPPSPPSSIVLAGDNQSIDLTDFVDPTGLGDGRPYTRIRLYRTSTGEDSDAEFLYVADLAVDVTTYQDNNRGTALGEIIPSTLWDPPPTDLVGLIELPNGILGGFRSTSNEVCFTPPYQPHAWPTTYRHTMVDQPVMIAGFGQSVLVGTEGRPVVITGTDPTSFSEEHIEVTFPCLSKRGMVDMGYAILYPTETGLVYVAEGEADVITRELIDEKQWKALVPSTFVAAKYHDRYICFYTGVNESGGFILDPKSPESSLVFLDITATEVWSDPRTDKLYLVTVNDSGDEEIVEWDGDETGIPLDYHWRSKEFVYAVPQAMKVVKVDSDLYPVSVNIYGDGQWVDSAELFDDKPQKISDLLGKCRKWEIETIGNTEVEAIYLATNAQSLTRYLTGAA